MLDRENGGLPKRFQTPEGLSGAIGSILDDSYTRTGSFDESAEVLSELFHGLETKMKNYHRVLNGKLTVIGYNILMCQIGF